MRGQHITITEQTGWKRPNPKCICQDVAALIKVTQLDYDPENPDFVRYFESRYGMRLYPATCCPGVMVREYLSPRAAVTETWKRITRAKLQDAWELFTGGQA